MEFQKQQPVFFQQQQALQVKDISSDEDEAMDVGTVNSHLSISILNNVLTKPFIQERKVDSAETKAAVGKNYEKSHLDKFQNVLKQNSKHLNNNKKCLPDN